MYKVYKDIEESRNIETKYNIYDNDISLKKQKSLDIVNYMLESKGKNLICHQYNRDDVLDQSCSLLKLTLEKLVIENIPLESIYSELGVRARMSDRNIRWAKESSKEELPQLVLAVIIIEMVETKTFLEELGKLLKCTITLENNEKNKRKLIFNCSNPYIKVIPIKPKDIEAFFYEKLIDMVICFDDSILNSTLELSKISLSLPNETQIVIAKRLDQDNKDIETKLKEFPEKAIIISEYEVITRDWLVKEGFHAQVIRSHGKTEAFLYNHMCDLIVVVCDSGSTLKSHELEIYEVLAKSKISFYYRPSFNLSNYIGL